jgi:hypothetical protein
MTFEHWAKFQGSEDYVKGLEIKYTRRAGAERMPADGSGMGNGNGGR